MHAYKYRPKPAPPFCPLAAIMLLGLPALLAASAALASPLASFAPHPMARTSANAEVTTLPGGALRKSFQSQVVNDTSIRYVKDSGICETTPGVGQVRGATQRREVGKAHPPRQMSGYLDIGTNMSMVSTRNALRSIAPSARTIAMLTLCAVVLVL